MMKKERNVQQNPTKSHEFSSTKSQFTDAYIGMYKLLFVYLSFCSKQAEFIKENININNRSFSCVKISNR